MLVPCTVQGMRIRGIFSHVREYPPWTPKRTQGALPLDPAIASEQLEEMQRLPIALPCAALPRCVLLYDLICSYYPLPLCLSRRSAD